MNRNNIFEALMSAFKLNINDMACFCNVETNTIKERRKNLNSSFTNEDLQALYFFFGVNSCEEIYTIIIRMSEEERSNILEKIKSEIKMNK